MIEHLIVEKLLIKRMAWQIYAVVLCGLVLLGAQSGVPAMAQEVRGPIYTVEVQGPVTSVTTSYLRDALRQAETANATALIITLSSNGGVLSDARTFAADLAQAKVPVVVYIAPEGINAGAPGTLLLSAAGISAMAPNTTIGSPYPLARVDAALSQQTRELVLDSVTTQLRTWNAAHGRNTDWLDQAVNEGAVLTNEQAVALTPPAVDIVATSQEQLLTLLQGRTAKLANGKAVTLDTLGRDTVPLMPSLWQSLRLTLANPTVAFALLIVGALALYLELAAPGTTLFAGIGVVLLLAAFAGLVTLPLQWWAMGLLVVGLLLLGLEFFIPVHGGLAILGLALLVVGALNLIDPTQAPGASVAGWAIGLVACGLAVFAVLGVLLIIRSRRAPVTTGQESMVGKLAEVRKRLDPEGLVFVEGALWRAISANGDIEKGDWVRVTSMHNLRLVVQHIDDTDESSS